MKLGVSSCVAVLHLSGSGLRMAANPQAAAWAVVKNGHAFAAEGAPVRHHRALQLSDVGEALAKVTATCALRRTWH